MNGGAPVLPIYTFMVWTGTILYFQFPNYDIEFKEDETSGGGGVCFSHRKHLKYIESLGGHT